MAKFDRCSICDYTESEGSSVAGLSRGENGKVSFYPVLTAFFCDICVAEQRTNLVDLMFDAEADVETVEDIRHKAFTTFKKAKDIEPVE